MLLEDIRNYLQENNIKYAEDNNYLKWINNGILYQLISNETGKIVKRGDYYYLIIKNNEFSATFNVTRFTLEGNRLTNRRSKHIIENEIEI